MANDGIRLPSDSTVASQKVHRGSDLPNTQITRNTSKEVLNPTPLLTVVLQSKTLIEGQKGLLVELLLQNDPKSAPPIRIQTDTLIKVGTSLLLELDEKGQYQPIEKPTQQQLIKLVNLELDFWRAHLLPKAGGRAFPALPQTAVLEALQTSQPSLRPLVQWLVQSPNGISPQTAEAIIRTFSPLNQLRPWLENPQGKLSNTSAPVPLTGDTAQSNTVNNVSLNNSTMQAGLTIPVLRDQSMGLKDNASLGALLQSAAVRVLSIPDTRIQQPIGEQLRKTGISELNTHESVSTLKVSPGSPSAPITPTMEPINTQKAFIPGNLAATLKSAGAKLQFQSQIFSVSKEFSGTVKLDQLSSTTFHRPGILGNSLQTNSTSNLAPTSSSIPVMSKSNETHPKSVVSTVNQIVASALKTVQNLTPAKLVDEHPLNMTPKQADVGSKAVTQNSFELPGLNLKVGQEGRIPSELRLNTWIQEIEKLISESPSHLRAQLRSKAESLLKTPSDLVQQIATEQEALKMGTKTNKELDDLPLLALKNWLEATQARIQNNAVSNAIHQWSTPEQTIQHVQIPLIWLGLTHWVDIEWWQEKAKSNERKKTDKESLRKWRMKIYLTMDPLEPICADIDWTTEETHVTFWSEDASTLHHINQLLPSLSAWTDGLGEKTLTTKHGMPAKSETTNQKTSNNHLVDIRT